MGRGIEIREASIRVRFSLNGKMVVRTLMVDDRPMPPT